MKSFNTFRTYSVAISFLGLFLLVGCGWFSKSKKSESFSGSDVLLEINGKPVLTVQEYEEQLDMARKANAQIDMLLQMMPNAEKDIIFRGMTTAKLMQAWAEKQNIDKSEEFQKQRKQLHDAMDSQLYMKYFDDAHPVDVSDSDVAQYYEEKKDLIPALTLTPGGVDISFVRFEDKNKAEQFLSKVKDVKKAAAFKTMAVESKQTPGTAVISSKAPFTDAIKNVVLEIKKFPSVHMIKAGDNAYWIVLATGKTETVYRDLKNPEIQQGLTKMLSDERKGTQLESVLEKLKSELNVVEHSKYFEEKAQQKQQEMQEMSEEMDEQQTPVQV
ncbi:peptidyl-prolyl cis-trans isomerase [Candidatus Babeliales bacterium]|nr:peptidyl-prolyl cis-trans isomerase [Candidatus Babeliales bacterium]